MRGAALDLDSMIWWPLHESRVIF